MSISTQESEGNVEARKPLAKSPQSIGSFRGLFGAVSPISFAIPLHGFYFAEISTADECPGFPDLAGKTRNLQLPGQGARSLFCDHAGRHNPKTGNAQTRPQQFVFIDPQNPSAGEITWQGSWRSLERPWKWSARWQNFVDVWRLINFPQLFRNTMFLAVTTEIGVLISCTLVAYGFARFRFPARNFLFTLLISTIFLPAAVTTIPTYTFFLKIGWVGTYLPLIIPAFFANAYDVFLLRQYFLTIPHEMDEAAMMDGAGPFRIFWSIILPQSIPVLVAVSVFHIVYAWNDYYNPLIYLSTRPDLQPIAVAMSRFNGIHSTNPNLIQATALMALVVPLIIFLLGQRFFMQGIVMTGVEK